MSDHVYIYVIIMVCSNRRRVFDLSCQAFARFMLADLDYNIYVYHNIYVYPGGR